MILCATLNWGFGYLIIHDAASKMPLNALMFSRYLIASGVLILIFRKRFADLDLSRLCKGGVLGFLIFTGQYLQTSALSCQGITPGETAFITTLYTVCVPVMNVLFFHACWSAANIVSVMLSVPGLLLLNGNGTLGFGTGQVLALLGMLAFSGHILAASMFTKEEDVIVLTTVQFGTAALLSLALSVLRPGHTRLVWSGYAIAVLLYLGVLNTMAGFLLQFFRAAEAQCGEDLISAFNRISLRYDHLRLFRKRTFVCSEFVGLHPAYNSYFDQCAAWKLKDPEGGEECDWM